MKKIEDIALFDMDGTLCDYDSAMERDYNLLRNPNEQPYKGVNKKINYVKSRIDLIRNQPYWWKNLDKLKSGFDILELAKELEFQIYILTKAPRKAPQAWTQKAEWINANVPNTPMIMSYDKGLVYGKVLVDDYPPYIERWLEHRPRGLVILPAHPWNKNFQHPNAIRCDGSDAQLSRVRMAMEIAKLRKPEQPLNLSRI
ncbi:hypothetical protein HYT23_01460 [Candidatus Pacearchaeota archaeon]|nr:hypothetical protein [Candidatus Pacearchaeota archaeon]